MLTCTGAVVPQTSGGLVRRHRSLPPTLLLPPFIAPLRLKESHFLEELLTFQEEKAL